MPVCATVGLPVHSPACAFMHAPACVCERVCTMGMHNWVCKHRSVRLHVGLVVHVCSVHVCTHAHNHIGSGCTPVCMHKYVGSCGWAAHVWAAMCCAQAPPDGALPPCHLHVTFRGPKPVPCGGTWGDIALHGVIALPVAGPWVLGLSSQAEHPPQ